MNTYITGRRVTARDLKPGALAHLQPHMVDQRRVGRDPFDVEVEAVHLADPAHAVLDYRIGHQRGSMVFSPCQIVLVIGHTDRRAA
jgi:hypothetical protein